VSHYEAVRFGLRVSEANCMIRVCCACCVHVFCINYCACSVYVVCILRVYCVYVESMLRVCCVCVCVSCVWLVKLYFAVRVCRAYIVYVETKWSARCVYVG